MARSVRLAPAGLPPLRPDEWKCGDIQVPDQDEDDADGAEGLVGLLLEGRAEACLEFVEGYYEVTPALEVVRHVYDLKPLTQEVVSALNPAVRLEDLAEDITRIGYPVQPRAVELPPLCGRC
ncbi:hypothetical protein ACWDYJ_32725 [Streptomyces sp. NPDC003042]